MQDFPSLPALSKGCLDSLTFGLNSLEIENRLSWLLPIPGEAKAKAMPGRLYIHTRNNNNKNK